MILSSEGHLPRDALLLCTTLPVPVPELVKSSIFEIRQHWTTSVSGHREAIKQPRSARADKILLATPERRMRRIPRDPAAIPAMVSQLRRACGVAGPVLASMVLAIGVGIPVRLRPSQDVMRNRLIAHTVH